MASSSSSSPYHNFDFESVAFGLGSFLVFEKSADLNSAFHDGMQLTLPSTALALAGLLNFLDKWYPGPRFFLSNKKRRGKIAAQWLGRAGRVYWGKDSGHIREDAAGTEGLEWPEVTAKERLQLCVVEMLDGLAPQARAFYQARSFRLGELLSMKREAEATPADADNDTQQSQKRIKLGSPISLPVRDKTGQ